MKIVLLCKSWSDTKVLDILHAFEHEQIWPEAIVALARPKQRRSLRELVQMLYYRGAKALGQKLFAKILHRPHKPAATSPAHPGDHSGNGTLQPEKQRLHPTPNPTSIKAYARRHDMAYFEVPDLNGAECEALLRRLATDLLVLGGTPIIRANILGIPSRGTINVHMGLLPKYRGRNVAEWSVFNGDAVGITVHTVDPGVDTGAILYCERIDVAECRSIADMRRKIRTLQHRALAKCARLHLEARLPKQPQNKADGKQYYNMHPRLRQMVVEEKLSRGYRAIGSLSH